MVFFIFPFLFLGMLGGIFLFLFKFYQKLLQANSEEPDQTPLSVASYLDLHCLPVSHKKDARLIWVNIGLLFEREKQQNVFTLCFQS